MFQNIFFVIAGSWSTMSNDRLNEAIQRLTQPTVASISRSRDCISHRMNIESIKQQDIEADVGLTPRPFSRQSSLMSSLSRPSTRQRSPSPNQKLVRLKKTYSTPISQQYVTLQDISKLTTR